MAISSDMLIERSKMKRQISFWRLATIGAVVFFLIMMIEPDDVLPGVARVSSTNYIARVTIDGVITDDRKLQDMLEKIRDNDRIKAVVLYLNTPGGTAVGGENLYRAIKEIREKKPVVATMGSLCASAGYMAAIAADRVFTQEGSITASIGVIFQSAEVTELAAKVGIKPIIVKSGPLKGSPNPLEPATPAGLQEMQHLVDGFFVTFKKMVADERHLTPAEIDAVADGRVVGGAEAVRLKLADQLGNERDAVEWLHTAKKIDSALPVKDVEPKKERKNLIERMTESAGIHVPDALTGLKLDGLLLIWQPALSQS